MTRPRNYREELLKLNFHRITTEKCSRARRRPIPGAEAAFKWHWAGTAWRARGRFIRSIKILKNFPGRIYTPHWKSEGINFSGSQTHLQPRADAKAC